MSATHSSAVGIRDAVRSGAASAVEIAKAAIDRASASNGATHAFLQIFGDEAITRARDVDKAVASGSGASLPLAGVPVALKDNICLEFGTTTSGSRILESYRSPFSATAAARLIKAGAVVIGKTNLDEFAMGSSTENSAFGASRNPWDLLRVPGGSSGGSAAAVASRVTPVALGSDTGGSIRQPAGFCGIVGIKPTYGRVSRYGLVAYASSLDQIGPLTTTVEDAALVLEAICGHDPHDSTSSEQPVPAFSAQIQTPIERLRLGVPRQARSPANHPEVARLFDEAIRTFIGLGAEIVDIDLPMVDHGIAAYYIVATAEASSNLARFDGIRYGRRAELKPGEELFDLYARSRAEGFGPEVQRRIMLGTHVLSSGYYDAYYTRALKARRLIKRDYDAALTAPDSPGGGLGCHAVLMPATPGPAFRIGEKSNDPLAMYLEDVYTVTVNLAGLPAITVPAGFAAVEGRKLPVGIQLVGAAFDESSILRAARMFERATRYGEIAPG